jgi:hypothetical protein
MILRILAFIGLIDIVLFVSALMSLLLYNLDGRRGYINEDEGEDEEQAEYLEQWRRDYEEREERKK